jgi:hypothetical protein
MAEARTWPGKPDISAFIDAIEPEARRDEARRLDMIFRDATGWEPRLWGRSIVGYGRYAYTYDSGHSGQSCATGFSPRKAELSLYILPGFAGHADLLADLGRHRTGKACLYIRRLSDIDEAVLARLIAAGVAGLSQRWTVTAE